MRSFLVLCIILALFDKLTSLRHPRILQHVQKNARNISPLHLKKIADEESKIKSDGGVSSKKGKEDKKGRKSNDNDDWRSKKKQNVGDQVASSPAITTPPAEEISRDDPSPKIEELLAAEAAAERALAEESVSMTEAVAAIESDSNSAQDTLKFIETMSMAGAGESSEMSTDGLLDNGRKEGRNRQMNDNDNMRLNPLDALLQVPKKNPLSGGILPPEVVFFGEPRRPPPVSSATSTTYQASLLYWARHGNSVPRDSMERMDRVFPKGRAEENASKYRLGEVELSFEAILKSWIAIMDNLEEAKAFICANVDLVPSKLFLRALTAKKLAAQSKGDVAEMNRIKDIRGKYILAHDQVYFPLNIERLKAETRVMTYLARDEIRNFARSWDSVEMSLHMTALIAARLQWDSKAEQMLDNIKARLSQTVDYMAEKTYNNLMNREFRRPSITAETYRNASLALEGTMPDLYGKIHPEVKLLHETYTLMGDEEYSKVKQYIEQVFCPREGVSVDELKVLLKLFDANLAAIQGMDYIKVRLRSLDILSLLCNETELDAANKWYHDMMKNGYGFNTYEPDKVPNVIKEDQRQRDTGSAFSDFWVQVMKQPTIYTRAFSGQRPKGEKVNNWLDLDPIWANKSKPEDLDQQLDYFRRAYIIQMEARKSAEAGLNRVIVSRMDEQDRILGGKERLVIEFRDPEEEL